MMNALYGEKEEEGDGMGVGDAVAEVEEKMLGERERDRAEGSLYTGPSPAVITGGGRLLSSL